jgi:hypothetical protein
MEPMARTARLAAASIAALTLLASCASPWHTHVTSVPTTVPATATLRGEQVGGFACPSPAGAAPAVTTVPTTGVTALLLGRPGGPGGPGGAVTVTPTDPGFAPLLSDLAEPDQPRSGSVCPLYADVVLPVLARAGSEVIRVHIPVDGCGHYEAGARAAIYAGLNPRA